MRVIAATGLTATWMHGSAVHGMSFAEEPFRPVSKVVALLTKMQKQLESERTEDANMDKKMSCWCHDTGKEKERDIAESETSIQTLKGAIEEKKGRVGSLATEVEELEHDIEAETASLAEATALRKDSLAKFNADDKDITQSINALDGAIAVLKKFQGIPNKAFLQQEQSAAAAALLPNMAELQKAMTAKDATLTPAQRTLLQQVVAQTQTRQIPSDSKNVYTTQSGEVFGILEQMLESFKKDHADLVDHENSEVAHFTQLKADKEDELAKMTQMKSEKEAQMERLGADMSADKEALVNTEESLAADTEFLQQMRSDCGHFDDNYNHRSHERSLELEAVATALEYLHSDEAHDLFSRTYSFTQLTMHRSSTKNKSIQMLKNVATTFGNKKALSLTQDIKAEAFEKVKAGIDKMVADLKEQIAVDTQARDLCIADLDQTDKDISSTDRDKADLEATKAHLDARIETLSGEMDHLQELKDEAKQALAEAGAMREKENMEFQTTVKNANESITVLNKALMVLQQVYASKFSASDDSDGQVVALLQNKNKEDPKPAGFENKYARNSGGAKVLQLISDIINDTTKAKELAIQTEQEEQTEYEHLVQDTNKSIKQHQKLKLEKKALRADRKKERKTTKKELQHTTASLEELHTKRQGRADECMYLLNNFELRQAHMVKESEALMAAKAYLEGMQ